MKYAIQYNNTSHILDKIDEIIVIFDKNKILNLFTEFIPSHQDQRVIIELNSQSYKENFDSLKKICAIHKENPTLKFDLLIHNFENEFIDCIKSAKLNYFFRTLVNDWDTFRGIIDMGVSDIYVVEQLAFELDKIAKIAHSRNIRVRVFPNVAQSSWSHTEGIYKFFIRPEDIELYEPYVDVCEFYGESKKNDTYYKIYTEDKKWFGNLNELIISLNSDLDSRFIIPRFAESRIKCGKKCLKGNNCQICQRILELSNSLQEANLIITIDKEDNKENEGTK